MTYDGRAGRAVVTGASSGIGAEYASRLVGRGWDLALVARRAGRLHELAERLRGTGADVEPVEADPWDLARVAERAAADDVSLLVNNAGINGYGPFTEVDAALLTKVIAVNVLAPTVRTRATIPGMLARGRGAVVNVASMLAFAGSLPPGPLPHRAVYGGSDRPGQRAERGTGPDPVVSRRGASLQGPARCLPRQPAKHSAGLSKAVSAELE
ncbi:SDR family NAD(P)-dependent oxidoreductase [Streptomyces sp. SudanB182_2057]|uniref:SDR family NAD(P)-dependent oxidoreductase n=1 Tax=Streptomyces sp. SudanB182_2057 TaxID=3035281 RepID=UPI003F570188